MRTKSSRNNRFQPVLVDLFNHNIIIKMVQKTTVKQETDEKIKATPEIYLRTVLLVLSWITMV